MMIRRERLRRVVIVCASFVRNLAYFRAGQQKHSAPLLAGNHPQASFWRQINSNFVDIAVLEWCKLFAENERGKGGYGWQEHGWRGIATDKTRFDAALLAHVDLTRDQFDDHIKQMRHYRDKFVAHLDSDAVMLIPLFKASEAATNFYFDYVAEHEAAAGDLAGLPNTVGALTLGYAQCFAEAEAIFADCQVRQPRREI